MWNRGRHRKRTNEELPDLTDLTARADERLAGAHVEQARTLAASPHVDALSERAAELARGNHFVQLIYDGLLRQQPPQHDN